MSNSVGFTYTDEQERIIKADRDSTMLIVAGAGSGKTFTMTQRIIELISEHNVSPEKILGLTFTKAAASELLGRVSSAVYKHRFVNSSNSLEKESGSDDASDAMFMKPEIYTYDAFFQSIVRQYGLLVGFDPSVVPLSKAGALSIAEGIVREHLQYILTVMTGSHDGSINSDATSSGTSDDTLDQISAISTFIQQIVNLNDAIASCMIDSSCTSVEQAVELIRQWDDAFIDQISAILDRDYPDIEADLEVYKKLVGKLEKITDNTFDKWMEENARAYYANLLHLIKGHTDRRQLLLDFVMRFDRAKRDMRMAQFADFTIAAVQLVQRFPWISAQYRERFSHVFLDEYQDSSTTQALLITQIFGANDTENPSRAKTAITAVGDPYQAIYGWRGASPGVFKSFQKAIEGAQLLSLSKTMRNPRAVLDMANYFTAPMRGAMTDQFNRLSTTRLREVDVKELSILGDVAQGTVGTLAYATQQQEIDGVVRYALAAVEKFRQENEALISAGKPARSGPSVAVLLRAKGAMEKYADALTAAGLRVQVEGVSSALERPDVTDIISLLAAIGDHSDSASAMRLLATPRFGLTRADLKNLTRLVVRRNKDRGEALIRHAGIQSQAADKRIELPVVETLIDALVADDFHWHVQHYYAGDARGKKRVLHAVSAFRAAQAALALPLDACIEKLAEILNVDIDVPLSHALTHGLTQGQSRSESSVRAVTSVDMLVSLAHDFESELPEGVTPTAVSFMQWLNDYDQASIEPAIVDNRAVDVFICTIHHSKGLEWDTVILPKMRDDAFFSIRRSESVKVAGNGGYQGHNSDGIALLQSSQVYDARFKSWVYKPLEIPAPVRADRQAIPSFFEKDDMANSMPDAATLEKRVEDKLHSPSAGQLDRTQYLSLGEEYGQIGLWDARRVVYVAMTRAKRNLLITTYKEERNASLDVYSPIKFAQLNHDSDDKSGPANRSSYPAHMLDKNNMVFFREAHEFLRARLKDDAFVDAQAFGPRDDEGNALLNGPVGQFFGDDAQYYAQHVVGQAYKDCQEATLKPPADSYVWPRQLDSRVKDKLDASAQVVAQQLSVGADSLRRQDDGQCVRAVSSSLLAHAQRIQATLRDMHSVDLTSDFAGDKASDDSALVAQERLIASAERIEADRPISVTTLQERMQSVRRKDLQDDHDVSTNPDSSDNGAGNAQQRKRLRHAHSILRPVPRRQIYDSLGEGSAASKGTRFHAWAEQFFMGSVGFGDGHDEFAQARMADIAIVDEDTLKNLSPEKREMEIWKNHLRDSEFVSYAREYGVEGCELNFTYSIDGKMVRAVLDAVFPGSVWHDTPIATQAAQSARSAQAAQSAQPDSAGNDNAIAYTIVDWKTGRKPRTEDEIIDKLYQLDMYRLILADFKGIDISRVDAALYYLSEKQPENRVIHARPRSYEDIYAMITARDTDDWTGSDD